MESALSVVRRAQCEEDFMPTGAGRAKTMVARRIRRDASEPTTTKREPTPSALLVQDSSENECRNLLEREGLEVLTARDCKEGLRVAKEEHPELVVVDLEVPEAKELALEIRLLPKLARVPVIAIGKLQWKSKGTEREIFDGYVGKPCGREEIRKIVRKLLGRRVRREVEARRDRPLKLKS
jgi:two-component system cell cycle response regulator DivK